MPSIPIIKQDMKINRKRIGHIYIAQTVSLLVAIGICELKLLEISDIFWDTIPVILIPLYMQMMLVYESVEKRKEDGTMDFILSAPISAERMLTTKILFLIGNTALIMLFSALVGCISKVYRLTGVWNQKSYLLLMMGGFCQQIFWGGFCFLVSGNAGKKSLYWKVAIGLPVIQYVLYLLYYWFPEVFFLKYVTVFSLFQHSFFSDQSIWLWIVSFFYLVVGVVFYLIGKYGFLKREYAQ